MIQVDDAGNGAVLGGEVIGALRVETGEYLYRILPLAAYANFELGRTLAAKDAVLELLTAFKPGPEEPIVFCTGDVFKDVKQYLTSQSIVWGEEKIVGDLQELVEATFFNSLREYGLPERFRIYHHDYHRFHTLVLHWVCQDLTGRSEYCKPLRLNSGLVSRAKVLRTIVQKNQTCALCNDIIPSCFPAVLDKTEQELAYFHLECFPSEVAVADYQELDIAGDCTRSFINKFPTPPLCSVCGQKIRYKKRTIARGEKISHFACFSGEMRINNLLEL